VFVHLELVWYRMLGPILGGTSFTFGLILAVVLAGIGIGGWLYAQRSLHKSSWTLADLALSVAIEAVAVAIPLALGDRIALLAAYARPMGAMGFGWLVTSWTMVSALVVLLPAIVSGYQFPLLLALLGRGDEQVASHLGRASAFNTVGCIMGSLLGGFVLIPELGAIGAWRASVVVLALLALALLGFDRKSSRRSWRQIAVPGLVSGLALVCASAEGPTAAWRHGSIGSGSAKLSQLDAIGLRNWINRTNELLLWERDGVEASVGLAAFDGYAFLVNGKSDGSTSGDRCTQTMAGLLPALLHPAPKTAFVLGLGTGMSAGVLARVPGIERVDVAELEPAILEVARAARAANFNVLEQPNTHLFLGDGREFLLSTDRSYDLISSEPSNPHRAGVASLFTEEFYRAVEKRLAPGGVFVQWFQGYQTDANTIRLVLRTLRRVLPVVEVWQSQASDFLFVASRERRVIDAGALRQAVAREPVHSMLLHGCWVEEAEGVLAQFVASARLVDRMTAPDDGPVNTDDKNVLEFAFARNLERKGIASVDRLLGSAIAVGAARPDFRGVIDWDRVQELRPRSWLVSRTVPQNLPGLDPAATARAKMVISACRAGATKSERFSAPIEPRDAVELYAVTQDLAERGDPRALELAELLERAGLGAEAEWMRAQLSQARNEPDAPRHALSALERLRQHPLSICGTDQKVLRLIETIGQRDRSFAGAAFEALMIGPLSAGEQDELRRDVALRMAFAAGGELCARALESRRHLEWADWSLKGRYRCLKEQNHPLAERAGVELSEFLGTKEGAFEPRDLGLEP
jgi:predicted membrane-bound spermidine synthase